MDLRDRITIDPAICHGKPCIRGLRYPVELITLDLPLQNQTPDHLINDLSVQEQRVVITKDAEFVASFLVHLNRQHLQPGLGTALFQQLERPGALSSGLLCNRG